MKKMTQEELLAAFETLADEKHHSTVFRASERIRQHLVTVEAEVAQARERALEEAAECAVRPGWRTRECDEVAADIRALKSKPAQEPEPGVADYCPEARPKLRREHDWEAGGPSQWRRCKRLGCTWTTQSWSRHDSGPWYCPRDGEKRQKECGPCEVEP